MVTAEKNRSDSFVSITCSSSEGRWQSSSPESGCRLMRSTTRSAMRLASAAEMTFGILTKPYFVELGFQPDNVERFWHQDWANGVSRISSSSSRRTQPW